MPRARLIDPQRYRAELRNGAWAVEDLYNMHPKEE